MNRASLRLGAFSMVLGTGAFALATLPFVAPAGAVATPGDTVFVNELHYDNASTDVGEFVEIAGPAGTDLTGWRVIPYNGSGGTTYTPEGTFSGTIPDQGDGYGTASVAILGLQNGAPDGIALVDGSNVVRQFLSYEGVFVATNGVAIGLTSTDIGIAEAGTEALGLSLGLTGTGTTYGDFTWATGLDDSPGTVNPGQTFGDVPNDVAPVINPATPANQNVAEGATATLTVATTAGTPPLSYQWYQGVAPDTSIPVGSDSASFTTPALTETTSYWVRVTNAVSAADSRTATVTVLTAVSIHDIQGAGHVSPLAGQPVVGVTGIVTAVRSNGFYIQEPDAEADADVATSEAILVFTSSAPPAAAVVGNHVSVGGSVLEFRPSATNLTITEITSPSVSVLSTGNALPSLTTLGGAAQGNLRQPPLSLIDEDAVAPGEEGGTVEDAESVFDPTNDGIDFYETLEGMRVGVTSPQAVSRTTDFGSTSHEIGIVAGDFPAAGTRTPRGGILYEGYDQDNPEMMILADSPRLNGLANLPSVDVGDSWSGEVVGIVDYAFDNPVLLPSEALPTFIDGNLQPEVTSLEHGDGQLTIATFNLENVDGLDAQGKFDGLAAQIVDNLLSPDIVVVEEIQDNDGALTPSPTTADVTWQRVIDSIAAAGGPTYGYRQIDPSAGTDGGEPGGNIRVGFLFRTDTGVAFVDRPGGTATTANSVVDASGVPQLAFSPGRIDPTNSAFDSSRKPLVGEFTFAGETFFVVGNHWNSKGGDQPRYGRFQPPNRSSEVQRLLQAAIVEDFVDDITAIDPRAKVVIAGDLNDYLFSPAVHVLTDNGYTSLVTTLPAAERYGYVFDGNSQILDHILASPGAADGAEFDTVHVNSEFYAQQSDHDPSIARFTVDTTPPIVTVDVAGTECAPGVYAQTATVTLSSEAGATITYAIKAPGAASYGSDTTYTSPFAVTAVGTSEIRYSAVDSDGNASTSATTSVTVTDFVGGAVSDDFNRPDGSLGPLWGDPKTTRFRIENNAVVATGGDTAAYRAEVLGSTQEAFVTFVDAPTGKGDKGLLLKVQSGQDGVPRARSGAISVAYRPGMKPTSVVVLAQTATGGNALQGQLSGIALAAGDQLGARVLPTGEVRIYVNCRYRGSVQLGAAATSYFAARGGTTGLMTSGTGSARLDDFGAN